MRVADITAVLDAWAPPHLAEDYDNVGLLVGDPAARCTGVLCTLDVTEAVLNEALTRGANLVVSHHPAWFGKRYNLTPTGFAGKVLYAAARRGLHLYAIHTNLDNVAWGVNRGLGEKLGLRDLQILAPRPEGAAYGAGAIGVLEAPMPVQAFLHHVARQLGTPVVRYTETAKQTLARVAICGGSGSFLLDAARAAEADALVTGDFTYHRFFDAEGELLVCDAGHHATEAHVPAMIVAHIRENFPKFALHLSEVYTNPVRTFVNETL